MTVKFIICSDPPRNHRGRPVKYDLDGMEVGDGFWMPHDAATTDITPIIAYRRRSRGWDRVYQTQTIDGRVRVERTA